jgi:2-polyprenyl-3-methyl-5-hydroxy-6-metoxy-1,4-benzoquinol methylase
MDSKLTCKICGKPAMTKFLSLGQMPIANAFLTREMLDRPEYKFELAVGFCENCKMSQLVNTVDKTKLFNENYAYFSSVSRTMEDHFKEFAKELTSRFLEGKRELVVEVGCNDGIMLKNFDKLRTRTLGIEPSANVAQAARDKGLDVWVEFFDEPTAKKIIEKHGKAKVVYAANVICHIEALHEFVKGVKLLLDKKGVLVFEEPYILDIFEKNSYDQIYDEHVWYFSVSALKNFFGWYGLDIFDCGRQTTHGGSMRYYVCAKGDYEISPDVAVALDEEKLKGVLGIEAYKKFADNVKKSKAMLVELVKKVKGEKKRLTGYGASSKGTVVLNYCGLTKDDIEYISDTTPGKIGTFAPGTHIPIVSDEVFHRDPPEYSLLLVWNYAAEIAAKEKDSGVKFIVHIPFARVMQ